MQKKENVNDQMGNFNKEKETIKRESRGTWVVHLLVSPQVMS